jgi:hypothetical protein
MLRKDYRSILGEDKADVIHFEKDWSFKWVNEFRNQLLKNSDIRSAFESVEQFPEWRPHLTLGYPETPAKEVENEYDLDWVTFDRIAVWTGNFEGPEFRLKWPDREDHGVDVAWGAMTEERVQEFMAHHGVGSKFERTEVPMLQTVNHGEAFVEGLVSGDISVEHAQGDPVDLPDITISLKLDDNGQIKGLGFIETDAEHDALDGEALEHYGVKGMRWGIRNDRSAGPKADAVKAKIKSGAAAVGRGLKAFGRAMDEHFYEQSIYSDAKHEAIHNQVSTEIDQKIYRLQTAPKYRGQNLKTNQALKTEYEQDVAKVTDAAYRRAVKEQIGENTRGTKEARYVDDARGARIEIREKKSGEIVRESNLRSVQEITADRLDTSVAGARATAQAGAAAKGRTPPAPVAPKATVVVPHGDRRKTKIKTDGGQNQPAADDAIKVAKARAKLKKSGPATLTNQELRDVAERMRLEEQVTTMNRSRPNRFIRKLLSDEGKAVVTEEVRTRTRNRDRGGPKR